LRIVCTEQNKQEVEGRNAMTDAINCTAFAECSATTTLPGVRNTSIT